MTDLQGHCLHGQSVAGSGYMQCGFHDMYHAYAARLPVAARGPVFPTGLPLCYAKTQKQGLLIADFS